jgi:hypothetical protein
LQSGDDMTNAHQQTKDLAMVMQFLIRLT